MDFKVKNTTLFPKISFFEMLFPDNCRGCGEREGLLCGCCKKYIFEHYVNVAKDREGEIFKKVFGVGYRDEIIGELVEEYKYYSARGMARVLAELLEGTALEDIKKSCAWCKKKPIIVPLPTSRKHIRERGFDHVDLILKRGAGINRDFDVERMLIRVNDSVQVGASKRTRLEQAKKAYRINSKYLTGDGCLYETYKNRPVIVFDDIWTTGASLTEGARLLHQVGASELYGVVLAVNRYGKRPVIKRGEFED